MLFVPACRRLAGWLPSIGSGGGSSSSSHSIGRGGELFVIRRQVHNTQSLSRKFIIESQSYSRVTTHCASFLPIRNISSSSNSDRLLSTQHQQDLTTCSTKENKTFQEVKSNHSKERRSKLKRTKETKLPERFKMEWPKITLFGDSITRRSFDAENGCWGSMVAYKVNSFFDVDPRGFEGYNSKWGLELMPKLFPKSYLDKVELFVLFFGHNDSWEAPPMHLSLEEYNSCMRNIIKYLLDNGLGREKIILITPSWFYLPSFTEYMRQSGLPEIKKELEDCEKYSEIVKKIGADEKLDVVDFFSVTAKYEPLEELFCDGVHFSRKGAKLLFDHLMPVIEKKLESSYKKPLADLWHGVPFEQHPEMVPVLEQYKEQLRMAKESGKMP